MQEKTKVDQVLCRDHREGGDAPGFLTKKGLSVQTAARSGALDQQGIWFQTNFSELMNRLRRFHYLGNQSKLHVSVVGVFLRHIDRPSSPHEAISCQHPAV